MITHSPIQVHDRVPASPGAASSAPSHLLKYQRVLRGWSRQDVADAIYDLCQTDQVPHAVGIQRKNIGRWERGESQPDSFYRKYLCRLYGVTADQLGLLQKHPPLQADSPYSERLQYFRLLRGWSQQDVADAIADACLHARRPRVVGVSAKTVGKWERREHKPDSFYTRYLCEVYGVTADKLGLM